MPRKLPDDRLSRAGRMLRTLRRTADLTLADVAREMQVDVKTAQYFELRDSVIDADRLRRLLAILTRGSTLEAVRVRWRLLVIWGLLTEDEAEALERRLIQHGGTRL